MLLCQGLVKVKGFFEGWLTCLGSRDPVDQVFSHWNLCTLSSVWGLQDRRLNHYRGLDLLSMSGRVFNRTPIRNHDLDRLSCKV